MDEEIEEIRKRKLEEMMGKPEYPDKPIEVNDQDFDEIIGKYPVVVVDFWSERCPPCIIIAPIIEELAKELSGKVVFGKMDVDRNMSTAPKFGIQGIPTLLVFKEKKLVDQILGAVPKEQILEKLKKYIK
ncbi:MAG: thioredoxin [Candidatus Aenigmarchaeota archaeon]|nr:thioredoxin [Candidatus Aenigmarchaeota archaeon]